MNQKHAFDVPELLEFICSHLELADYAACARVCRHWSSVFTELIWRDVSITHEIQKKAILSAEGQQGLSKNAPVMQSIQVRFAQVLDTIMALPHSTTSNLRRFVIPASYQYIVPECASDSERDAHRYHIESIWHRISDRQTYQSDANGQPQFTQVQRSLLPASELLPIQEERWITFISNLSGLRELTLLVFPFNHGRILQAIADSLPMLERLQLGNHQSLVPDLGALRYLIHCLPPNLSYLGLSIYFAATTDPNQWRRLLLEAPNTKLTKIKELFIDGNMQGLEGSLFMALIKRSHHLEKISISSSSEDFVSELSVALKENCPKLTRLAVGYTERPIRDREWASLLGASQGWREVSILRVTRFGSFAREALLGHAETLESVSISMCLGFPEQFFLTLLKLCPKLKALNRFNYDNKDNYVIRPISFSATNIACTGSLKFLRISLPFPSPRDRIASLFDQLSETIGNVHQATSQSQVYLANLQQIQPITTDQDQAITTDAQQPPQAINPFHAVIQQLNQYPELSQSLQSNTVTLQHHVFQRLASLTELEELWLGESDPHQMSVEHLMLIKRVSLSPEHTSAGLKFTLDEGLDTLKGMKKLKVLGVRGLAHGIGVLELEWMVHHWPKLEKIDGLFSEKEDPEMRLWLKDNAPYLQF